jgi:4'-phosphopantetheinyl transferase
MKSNEFSKKIRFDELFKYAKLLGDMNDVILLYTITEQKLDDNSFNFYLNYLNSLLQHKVVQYKRRKDQYNCLFGKLLVYVGYYLFTNQKISFDDYAVGDFGKPYLIHHPIKFNISHTDNIVICAFSKQCIGIDIESIKNIDIQPYSEMFSAEEMVEIINGGCQTFYTFWTTKEAIAKALGKGFQIPFKDIKICNNTGSYLNEFFYLKNIRMENAICTLAMEKFCQNILKIEVVF